MKDAEQQYLDILSDILDEGVVQTDRTGTGTRELWGTTMRVDLAEPFPILTTKKVKYDLVLSELCWMLRGGTNVKYLHEHGNHIWDNWMREDGELGPVYGAQWRGWGAWKDPEDGTFKTPGIDQLEQAIDCLKVNPQSRRIIVSAWNVGQLAEMELPPCHLYYQFNVQNGKLNVLVVMRSVDWFIGAPFNICQYATLTHWVAKLVGLEPGIMQMQFGSCHLYSNHVDQAITQLRRDPMDCKPSLTIDPTTTLETVSPEHFSLGGYRSHPFIKAPIAV